MPQTSNRQQRRHQATIEEIKTTARQQIARDGAVSLSLGAIARAMGMTPPALYRYFENRDALVAALVVDTYDSMGTALESAVVNLPQEDYAGRFLALMRAYRQWAVEHPEAYALMYSRVEMSEEQAQAFQRAVIRSMYAMVQVLRAAYEAGRLIIPTQYQETPPFMQQALMWMQSALQDQTIPLSVVALTLMTWLRADGLVWQELHGHLPKRLFGSGELYEMEARVLAEHLGLAAS